MSAADAWLAIEKLFRQELSQCWRGYGIPLTRGCNRIFDKDRDGKLNLDELVTFVAEVKKMDIVNVDEGSIVGEMIKREAEFISFKEFKEWSLDSSDKKEVPTFVDPFGNTNILPERFKDPSTFVYKMKAQHPCYTTSYSQLGVRPPSDADMPTKWRGHDGNFTDTFIINEPGKGMQINRYIDRSLSPQPRPTSSEPPSLKTACASRSQSGDTNLAE